MGRGFGRGARVTVVTRAQAQKAGKKIPRGMRTSKKKMKRMRRERSEMESAAGGEREKHREVKEGENAKAGRLRDVEGDASLVGGAHGTLAHQIASVKIPTLVRGKGQKLKELRKQLMKSVKQIRQSHAAKARSKAKKQEKTLADQYAAELNRREKKK